MLPIESPPWEAMTLVSQSLDPKTLAKASCVSKQWQLIMSSDHLWRPIFFSHHPSLSTLDPPNNKPYHHLFSSMHRKPIPPRPSISVSDLIIAVDVFRDNTPVLTVAKPWEDLVEAVGGVFRYDVDVGGCEGVVMEGLEGVSVSWTVVMKGWRGVFVVMERRGGGKRSVGGEEVWFSEEVPGMGCCCCVGGSGLVGEVGLLGLCGGEGSGVRVRVGLMSVRSWRYVSVEDGLKYLQEFLLR